MGTLTAWLLAIIGPLTGRAIAAAGFSAVSLLGVQAAFDSLKDLLLSSLEGLPLAVIQLAGLAGVWDAIGIFLGAITWCITWHLLTGASRFLLTPTATPPAL